MSRIPPTMRVALSIVALVVASGCSGSNGSEETAKAIPDPPENPGTVEQLVGSTWAIGPYVLEFREPPEVRISGEAVPIPGGLGGEYEVDEGIIHVRASALGKDYHYIGTWDGDNLVIDGEPGEKA